jgi:hypothetical protein
MSTTALRRTLPNWVTFPRELRDAIPESELCIGRVLQLEHADVAPTNTEFFGRRVAMKLTVCETGKLTGVFNVLVSLNIDAAKALGDLLLSAAENAAKP